MVCAHTCGQCMMCFCSDPMSNTIGIYMHNLASYIAMLNVHMQLSIFLT